MTIIVLNTKGGASKSTYALQVAASYFLQRDEDVELYEFDDENRDAEIFSKSAIRSKQIKVGDGSAITDILRNTLLDTHADNVVIDVGGNKTTTIFISGLEKSMLYRKIDLVIIPMSGGAQDLTNAVKTYDMVKGFGVPVIFGLGRVRNMERLQYQYQEYFMHFPNEKFIAMSDSDVVDLSRNEKKSIYELAMDDEYRSILESELIDAFDTGDDVKAKKLSFRHQIYGEAGDYLQKILMPAWDKIGSVLIKAKSPKENKDKK